MKGTRGKVAAVNGNMVAVDFDGPVMMNEVAFVEVDKTKLKSEVIRIKGNTCSLQVFEMTKGVAVGDNVEFSGDMLAIELGPGLLWKGECTSTLCLPTRNGLLPLSLKKGIG